MPLDHHEPREQLPAEVLEQHRAVESVIEELEAALWYQERAAASGDAELKSVLEHNRDEEIEHASMLLEWLRRNFPGFDEQFKTYLFTDLPITEVEEAATGGDGQAASAGASTRPASGSLNIGAMKEGA
jgi:hypothetical protein